MGFSSLHTLLRSRQKTTDAGLVRIIEAIVRNENSVLTVSSLVRGAYHLSGVCISLPSVVNQQGVVQVLELPLAAVERFALDKSAQMIRTAIDSLELQVA